MFRASIGEIPDWDIVCCIWMMASAELSVFNRYDMKNIVIYVSFCSLKKSEIY